jgi:sugar/nucleoside kinase (ribokinase family)
MIDLLTVGDAFEDVIFHGLPRLPALGEELKTSHCVQTVGGGAVITAVAAARLGTLCGVLSALSTSAHALLTRERILAHNLREPHEPAALSVALSTTDERCFVTYLGVNDRLEARLRAALESAPAARHYQFAFQPADCARWRHVVLGLRHQGCSVSWDFGWSEELVEDPGFIGLLGSLDIVFVNEREAEFYASPHPCDEFWRAHASTTVIKLGPRGARLIGEQGVLSAAGEPADAVDTTGAGDAFNGGFLAARLQGRSLAACLQLGNRIGALSTRQPGGIAGLPTEAEAAALMLEAGGVSEV